MAWIGLTPGTFQDVLNIQYSFMFYHAIQDLCTDKERLVQRNEAERLKSEYQAMRDLLRRHDKNSRTLYSNARAAFRQSVDKVVSRLNGAVEERCRRVIERHVEMLSKRGTVVGYMLDSIYWLPTHPPDPLFKVQNPYLVSIEEFIEVELQWNGRVLKRESRNSGSTDYASPPTSCSSPS